MSHLFLTVLLFASDTPRYHLEPGLELNYTLTFQTEDADKKKAVTKSTSKFQINILNKNADGSYRVVLFTQHGSEQPKARWDARRFDLFPDGRAINESEPVTAFSPLFLPPLPQGTETQWSATIEREQVHSQFRLTPFKDGRLQIRETRTSPILAIYDVEGEYVYIFDPAQRLITGGVGTRKKYDDPDHLPYKHSGSGDSKQSFELTSKKTHPVEWVKSLSQEAETYFTLKADAEKRYRDASRSAGDSASNLMEESAAKWLEAKPLFKHPTMVSLAEEASKNAKSYIKWMTEDIKRRASILGQPVTPWEAKDFEGRSYSSESLKGKVVILDFWYRGCLWCVRAMPQMNQLAADFKNEDVVILGVNIDEDPADARFVIRQAKLTYPNLEFHKTMVNDKPHKLLESTFGYPTLLIIDKQGNVADIHVGYSPKLRQEVTESVRKVLGK